MVRPAKGFQDRWSEKEQFLSILETVELSEWVGNEEADTDEQDVAICVVRLLCCGFEERRC